MLVCSAFHGQRPSDKHEAAHNDGDKSNDSAENLRWATRRENEHDKFRHGTRGHGDKSPGSKLTDEQARSAIMRRRNGDLLSDIATDLNVSASAISMLVRGKTWPHLEEVRRG